MFCLKKKKKSERSYCTVCQEIQQSLLKNKVFFPYGSPAGVIYPQGISYVAPPSQAGRGTRPPCLGHLPPASGITASCLWRPLVSSVGGAGPAVASSPWRPLLLPSTLLATSIQVASGSCQSGHRTAEA